MALSLTELLAPKTADQIEDDLLASLTADGFPVTAWQSGSVPRTLIRIEAVVLAMLWGLIALVARAAFLDTAEGAWLTLHAFSRFGLTRIAATFARHSVTLTVASGAGPYTITPGQLVMSSSSGLVRYRSTNTTNVVVATANPATITLQAETAGTTGNTAPASIVAPALAGLGFTYGSLAGRARDEETDAQLRTRCRARWATLAGGATRDWYLYHLLNAVKNDGSSAGVTRVGWIAPPGDNTFEVIVAGSDGPLTTEERDAVEAHITDVSRKGYLDEPTITNATQKPVTLAVTVVVKSESFRSAAFRLAASNAVKAVAAGLDIGQTLDVYAIGAAIYAAVPNGVKNLAITTPTGDTTCTAREVITVDTSALESSGNWTVG